MNDSSTFKVDLRVYFLYVLVAFISILHPAAAQTSAGSPVSNGLEWPAETQTARPWTRWWWHGSAVDEANLTRLLEQYEAAGLGGVEITCIYSVKNNEQRDLMYLSDEWIEAVRHTVQTAKHLDLGVDLPAGSGWRMGGPSVTMADANSRLDLHNEQIAGGKTFTREYQRATPQLVIARNADGEDVNLTDQIKDNRIEWTAPAGDWTVYSLAYRWAGDRVKRPGPGGEGLNINPFTKRTVSNFLKFFGEKLDQIPGIRAQFHDSFEYEGDWQPEFFEAFARRRAYRLEDHLPALSGDGSDEIVGRLKHDYRQTLADLVLEEFIGTWVEWSHQHGQLARNQSHGSPANWLDLYAACDIPEIESFGRLEGGDAHFLILKFAASAANVVGRKLVSSETATWLDEHFTVSLDEVREIVDRQILAGVNHVFYHGTAYSPDDAQWPGWLFYASSQLNPQNPIWHDFPILNRYVTRCQSLLQASQPDNDVLLYWPLHDWWHEPKGLRMNVRVHNSHDWFFEHPFGDAAELLEEHGYAFDYVSDRGLSHCEVGAGSEIVTPGGNYRAIVVPRAKHLPIETLRKLLELAEAGCQVCFWGDLPGSEPGLAGETASDGWNAAISRAKRLVSNNQLLIAEDLLASLKGAGVRAETAIKEAGLDFLRKRWQGQPVYFVRNRSKEAFSGWISAQELDDSVAIMDAMTGRIALAETKEAASGSLQIRLQLAPRESVFLYQASEEAELAVWPYRKMSTTPTKVAGPWNVKFIEGGPTLPASFEVDTPVPWTEAPDESAQAFAGTVRYSTSFDKPQRGDHWLLDLGKVAGSARVRVNGVEFAQLISRPFVARLPELRPTGNRLEIEVTGVAANRIRDLDRRGVEWRIFKDINLVNIDYRKFDASNWPVRPLGLHGPVTLHPQD